MPRVSAFYGVVIYMYWNERDHPVAHFHAYHAGTGAQEFSSCLPDHHDRGGSLVGISTETLVA